MKNQLLQILKTEKHESRKTRLFRLAMNLYPMFFATGGKILFWSADWSEVHLKLSLNIWTRNYVNTIFGGSMFSATDPFYMIMLMHMLGKDNHVVWDKSAHIKFKRPSKKPLYAKFHVSNEDLIKIRDEIAEKGETTYIAHIKWVDPEQNIYAELERTIYAANKDFYKKKLAARKKN